MWKFFFNHPTLQYNFESMECHNPIFIYFYYKTGEGKRAKKKK